MHQRRLGLEQQEPGWGGPLVELGNPTLAPVQKAARFPFEDQRSGARQRGLGVLRKRRVAVHQPPIVTAHLANGRQRTALGLRSAPPAEINAGSGVKVPGAGGGIFRRRVLVKVIGEHHQTQRDPAAADRFNIRDKETAKESRRLVRLTKPAAVLAIRPSCEEPQSARTRSVRDLALGFPREP